MENCKQQIKKFFFFYHHIDVEVVGLIPNGDVGLICSCTAISNHKRKNKNIPFEYIFQEKMTV